MCLKTLCKCWLGPDVSMLRLKQTVVPKYFTSNGVCPTWAISVLMKYFYQSPVTGSDCRNLKELCVQLLKSCLLFQ